MAHGLGPGDTIFDSEAYIPFNNLEICEEIGRGGYGIVSRGYYLGTEVAIKVLLDPNDIDSFIHEAKMLKALRHPNVVLFLGISHNEGRYYIVQEFIKGGSLKKLLSDKSKVLPWITRVRMAFEIALALNVLHVQHKTLHRDLKCDNVLLDKNKPDDATDVRCKVADFGLSIMFDPTNNLEEVGDVWWRAPEVNKRIYDQRADIFSLGMVFFEIITRKPGDEIRVEMTYEIKGKILEFGVNPEKLREVYPPNEYGCPPALFDLAVRCCNQDPSARPSIDEISDQLRNLSNELMEAQQGAKAALDFTGAEVWISIVCRLRSPSRGEAPIHDVITGISQHLKQLLKIELDAAQCQYLQQILGKEAHNSQVSIIAFGNFWKWWSKLLELIRKYLNVIKKKLILGFISPQEAEKILLETKLADSFVVRFSTSVPGSLVLTCYSDEKIIHVLATGEGNGFTENNIFYAGLKEMLKRHSVLSRMKHVISTAPVKIDLFLNILPNANTLQTYSLSGSFFVPFDKRT